MSGYERLRPLLGLVVRGEALGPSLVEALADMDVEERPTSLREAGGGAAEQAARELELAREALQAIAVGEGERALGLLLPLLARPMVPSPFETALEEVGARLAMAAGDSLLATRFVERRQVYWQRFSGGAALLGLSRLLADPEAFETVAAALETALDDGDPWMPEPAAGSRAGPKAGVEPGFEPFAMEEAQANAYVVTLRHLEDARTASFAVHRVGWHELEGDDPEVSDLVLSFEPSAADMLRGLDPEMLCLRLFFGDGPAFDEVSTADGSLFEVEINPPESRIYLKLRRPPAWSATNLAAAELWRHLRSCVLITEPG